jgi:hypothetical protein
LPCRRRGLTCGALRRSRCCCRPPPVDLSRIRITARSSHNGS